MLRAPQRPPRRTANPAFNEPCIDVTYITFAEFAFIQLRLKHTVHVLHAAFGWIYQPSTATLKLSVRPLWHHRQQHETAFRGEPQHIALGGEGERKEKKGGMKMGLMLAIFSKRASRIPWSRRESAALCARHPNNPNNPPLLHIATMLW